MTFMDRSEGGLVFINQRSWSGDRMSKGRSCANLLVHDERTSVSVSANAGASPYWG